MIGLIAASLIMFFIPGYTFINALFPGKDELDKDLDILYRIAYSIVMSVVFVVLIGYILGNLHLMVGYGSFYKSPYIWSGLSVISIIFFVSGWYRGAYQWLGKLHPKLDRSIPNEGSTCIDDFDKIEEMESLVRKQHDIKDKIKKSRKKEASDDEISSLEEELEDTVEDLKRLEKERAESLEEEE